MTEPERPEPTTLEELYAGLETVECIGRCWNSCGPIMMSKLERERIAERGVEIPAFDSETSYRWSVLDEPLHCPALTELKRCSVYEVRPLICRVYGVGRGELACRWGCKVSGRRLKTDEVMALLLRSFKLGGWDSNFDDDVDEAEIEAMRTDPTVAALTVRYMNGDRSVAEQISRASAAALDRHRRGRPSA